jgi:quinol monooxygenase YgiN
MKVTACTDCSVSIFVRARFDVRDGRQTEFEEIALALAARAADEAETVTYRWFGPDNDSYVVIEQYSDTAAALLHNQRSEDLLARVAQAADMVSAELYGPLGPELLSWAAAHPQVAAFPDFPRPADASPPA